MNWPIGWFSVWFFYDKALRAIRFQMSWLFFYLWKSQVDMSIFLNLYAVYSFWKGFWAVETPTLGIQQNKHENYEGKQ